MARKNGDIEMQRGGRKKQDEEMDDTEYRPINWKRFFFAPKYIRTSPGSGAGDASRRASDP